MRDIKPYAVFAEVVRCGSMSAAARRLGLTPSAVSQAVTGLERQAGVKLLHRSTRKLAPTEAGERCLVHCLRLVEAAEAAAASLEQARDAPSGTLRIAAPVGFGAHIAAALAPVLAAWKTLRLQLVVDDALVDLVEARVDLALRAGPLPDTEWVGRGLGDLEPVLCAAPAYLARHGSPRVDDLHAHDWLGLGRDTIALDAGGARVTLPLRASTNNQIVLQHLCEQGMGIARLFQIDVRPALERGTLVRVLPDLALPRYPLTLLTPGREGEPAKTRVAVEALKRYFGGIA